MHLPGAHLDLLRQHGVVFVVCFESFLVKVVAGRSGGGAAVPLAASLLPPAAAGAATGSCRRLSHVCQFVSLVTSCRQAGCTQDAALQGSMQLVEAGGASLQVELHGEWHLGTMKGYS